MNPYVIPPILCAAVSLTLGAFVFSRNPRSKLHRSFALLCWETTWWQLSWFISYFLASPAHKDLICRVAYISIVFLPVTYYHYAVHFLGRQREWKLVRTGYAAGAVFQVLLWTSDLLIAGYTDHWWGYYPRVGILHPVYLTISLVIVARALIILWRGVRHPSLTPAVRNRNRFAFYSHFIYSIAIVEYAITYGIVEIYPVGVFAMLVAFGITSYAIVRHRLMDISLAVTRTAVFAEVYVLILGVPLLSALVWQPQLEATLGHRWWVWLWIFGVALTTVAHYTNLHFQHRAEGRLLAEERKAHQALREISQNMMRFTRLNVLVGASVKQLVRVLQVPHAAIYLLNEEKGLYERKGVWHSPPRPRRDSPLPASMPTDSSLLTDLGAIGLPRVREEIKLQQEGVSRHWREMAADLDKLQASVVVPAFKENKLFGFVLLGDKKSGRIWSQDDLNVLTVLANQAALAVENAQLHEAEEQRLIKEAIEQTAADISYGVSHQFNNRLYVISIISSSQVLSLDGKDLSKLSTEELVNIVNKLTGDLKKITEEAEMGGQISKGIMSLAKAIPENFKPIELAPVIKHAIEFVQIKHSKEKVEGDHVEPEVVNGVPHDLSPISGNSAQIHDSIMNIVDNALDAIREKIYYIRKGDLPAPPEPYKGRIQVQAQEKNGWIIVTIEDDGMGIEKENLRRIFAPYFTTKATGTKGKGLGGHGLGLYFIKKIVEAHGGKVYVNSEPPKWTRFTVELPVMKEGDAVDAA